MLCSGIANNRKKRKPPAPDHSINTSLVGQTYTDPPYLDRTDQSVRAYVLSYFNRLKEGMVNNERVHAHVSWLTHDAQGTQVSIGCGRGGAGAGGVRRLPVHLSVTSPPARDNESQFSLPRQSLSVSASVCLSLCA